MGCGKKNPEITREQVRRAASRRRRVWQANRRGTTELRHTAHVVAYHQRRNLAAKTSRQKAKRPRELAL